MRDIRDSENALALGGMRNPYASVAKVSGAREAGRRIRGVLDRKLLEFPEFVNSVLGSLGGRPMVAPPDELVKAARLDICSLAGNAMNEGPPGICPQVISTYLEMSGDPDICLPAWLVEGAPLGINRPISRTGVFPPVPDRSVDAGYLSRLVLGPSGWVNYRSAESEPDLTLSLLDSMVTHHWAESYDSWAQAEKALGTSKIVLNKLALISKARADGTLKHRLVWDLRRSGVNMAILQGERVVLPRLADLVRDVQHVSRTSTQVYLMGTDVSDAFHQVPLHPSEQAFTVASVAGRFFIFRVLVFGSGSAPTVWGRFSAFLGRSTAAIIGDDPLRLQVYVDDPIYAAAGPPALVARLFAVALLWACVAGFPLSWKKTEGGTSLRWIGAQVTVECDSVVVSIPEDKGEELKSETRNLLRSSVCGVRRLRSYAGLVSFYAGLIPHLRPFLSGVWAVLPHHSEAAHGHNRGWIHTKRIRTSLLWFLAFFGAAVGDLVRRYPFADRADHSYVIVTDASPWGVGGVLYWCSRPVAFFCDELQSHDLNRFRARVGDSAFTTLWEALAILIGLRVWRPLFGPRDAVRVRSDSHGSLSAIASLSSSSASLNVIICEIALDSALADCALTGLDHIPGISNTVSDALSRVHSPDPKPWPVELHGAIRATPPLRDEQFYRSRTPPAGPETRS